MKMPIAAIGLGALLLAHGESVWGHHSLGAEFDLRRPVTLTGIVTKVEWTSPHTFVYLDIKDPVSGKVVQWACQLGSPNSLIPKGWTRDTLRTGMLVTLNGNLGRDGSRKVLAREFSFDGKVLRVLARP